MALEQRWIIGDFITGEYWFDLPALAGSSWSHMLGTPEEITAGIALTDVDELGLVDVAVPWRSFLGVVLNDRVIAAGPIIHRGWGHDNGKFTLTAKGMWSWLARRVILPPGTTPITIYDEVLKRANPANNTTVAGSYRDIIRRLIQQAMDWPQATPPIIFQFSEGGPYNRSYLGTDLKSVGEACDQVTELIDGVDFEMRPSWIAGGRDHVVWVATGGTLANPYLSTDQLVEWDMGADDVNLSGLTVTEDSTMLTTKVWFTGGRSEDVPLFAASQSPLLSAGWPLLETVDSSHTSISTQATLQGWADDYISTNDRPVTLCSFSVRGDEPPTAQSYDVGAWVNLICEGVPLLADGVNEMRLLGMAGSIDSAEVKLTMAPVRSADAWLP